jgi:hypothetical protein
VTTTDEPREASDEQRGVADKHRGLLIEAELTVDLPNSVLELHTEHDTLYVEAKSFAALRKLRATAQSEAVDWLRQLGLGSPLRIETPVLVRVQGVPVARYDPSQPPGRLADLFGISPFRIDLSGVVQAGIRRRRG